MIHKLRRRFILIAVTSVTLVMALLTLSVNALYFVSVTADLDRMLQTIQENRGSVPDPFHGGKPGPNPHGLGPETPFSTRYFVLRYRADGTLDGADLKHIAAVLEEDVDGYRTIALEHGTGSGYAGDYRFLVSETSPGRYMAVFLDCQRELHSVRTFALVSVLVVAVCIILVFLLVVLLSRRAIDPVVKSAERQKQFITDAGHELKTPITVITTSLKVLEMEVGQQKWIDKAQAQADRLRELVNELVALSRLDEERPALKSAPFDLSEAVADTAEPFRDFAAAQGRTLTTEITPGILCRGDEYALRQLVCILLDNAVKYSTQGGQIRLRLEKAHRGAVLTVSNPCSGLSSQDLPRLFDRFYRAEKSRSKQTGGFGLGLSIARSIVEAHRGTIRAECPEEGAVQFVVTLK